MHLAFVINDIATEKNNYTTIRLARTAAARGHQVALIGLDGFVYSAEELICANAVVPRGRDYADDDAFLEDVQAPDARTARISVAELDVLLLRSDPAEEAVTRPWASNSSLLFAQLAASRRVIVLNDPTHLTDASNKTYFQGFPQEVRPVTCITRSIEDVRSFAQARGGRCVIKPLQGSGGHNVFVIDEAMMGNLNQMVEAITRDGYVIVQEFLPEALEGDLRLLTLNGRPLQVDGQYACFRRRSAGGDVRNNISAGGTVEMAEPDAAALRLAEMVAPKLIRDGMYFAGLDIVGDRMIEVNVDTPGGINMAQDLTGIDFAGHMIDDLERKVRMHAYYNGTIGNTELACL